MTDINPGQLGEAINWKADRDLKNLDSTGTVFVIQTGTIIIWPGTTVPDGYLLCDGSAISRTTYSDLFAVIGTTYGSGDSSGTFNLPNFQGRYLKQGTVGTYGSESLPNITGNVASLVDRQSGAFLATGVSSAGIAGGSGGKIYDNDFNASRSSSTYQNNAKVNPDNAEIMYVIKF